MDSPNSESATPRRSPNSSNRCSAARKVAAASTSSPSTESEKARWYIPSAMPAASPSSRNTSIAAWQASTIAGTSCCQ